MSKTMLSLVAIAIFLIPGQLVAKQTENDTLVQGEQLSTLQRDHGRALGIPDVKTERAPDVVVDLSGIDSAANDPLDSPIDDSSHASSNWISGTGFERWTRHPVAAAAISFGLVLLGYGLLRMMGGRSPSRRPGRLPRQVIELVGFVPLSPRQQLQLVRLGSKLVLVAVSANGAEPLAEVTDPVEVDQILAACNSGQSALASAIGRWSGRQAPREYSTAGDRRGARALFEA